MIAQLFFERIKGVEDEFVVSRLALARLQEDVRFDPEPLHRTGKTQASLRDSRNNLEKTYVVRLFAEFEASVRQIYMRIRSRLRSPRGRVTLIMNAITSHSGMGADALVGAHQVREYRNSLVHEGEGGPVLSLADCRALLCRFLGAARS